MIFSCISLFILHALDLSFFFLFLGVRFGQRLVNVALPGLF